MRKIILFISALLFLIASAAFAAEAHSDTFLVLCYHDIPKDVQLDNYGVDQVTFVQQIEYLRTHGYHFVSLEDIIRAHKRERPLPEKAVLLTFDDGYLSFYEFVYPLLNLYGYPCVLAIVPSWIDYRPKELTRPLMNWRQIKEVAQSSLVEIASHTNKLHKEVVYNPQGNLGWATASRVYNPVTRRYEKESEFRSRVREDLRLSREALKNKIGIEARVLVWPYGKYNQIGVEEAKSLGFQATFTLEDELARVGDLSSIPRYMMMRNPATMEFIRGLKSDFREPDRQRALQADLDLIYDPDPTQQEKNLNEFIERVFNMQVNAVYLQAFCDATGDGNIASVYFPNRVLPVKADLFSRVVNQLRVRDIQVYAWMPMLSIVLPDEKENQRLKVKSTPHEEEEPWYTNRLSPFNPQACQKLALLYEDMAMSAKIDGVIFQDDGYLNDFEDFSPLALQEYRKISGNQDIPYEKLSPEKKLAWTRVKTKALIELSEGLKKAVLRYRPNARFARTLYAPVLLEPESEEWLAQNYVDSLKAYDYVVIMAYPYMEEVFNARNWLTQLVRRAQEYPRGLEKTVFKVQTYDWKNKHWINSGEVNAWLRTLVAAGAKHLAYYPDDYTLNQPDEKIIRLMMSVEDFPFKR